jgi:tRNA A-37 threonylcarbamoyl transferase component Bud32
MAMLAEFDFSNTTIRRFDIQRLIARGGMGEVYLARDSVLGRDLALKILRQDVTWDANRLERFVQEARAASALNHPHLIAIYDIGESAPKRDGVAQGPPVLYIAMELVAGETLRKAIESKRLDTKRTLEYLVQVVDALGAAHAAGVIHRDLKPENLMIADGGYAKVLDFGVAKLRADLAPPGADSDVAPSAGVIGTVGYMSPEQVQGKPLDPRTDIFSFGCVLYEAITGRRAFQGKTSFETLKRILTDAPEPIVEPLPHVQLQPVIMRCLAKNPDDRYQSMQELSHELRGVLRRLETATHRETRDHVPWRRLLAGAAGIIALVVADLVDDRERVPWTRAGECWNSASHAQRHRHRRSDLARRPISCLGRIDRRHAGAARASARRGSQHRARSTGARWVLGDYVLARCVASVLRDQERAGTSRAAPCRERAGRHATCARRRHRQHDCTLAGRTAIRVLSRQFPGARNVIAPHRRRRGWQAARAGDRTRPAVLRSGVLCRAVVVA